MVLKIQRPNEKKPREVELVRKQILVDQVTYYGVAAMVSVTSI